MKNYNDKCFAYYKEKIYKSYTNAIQPFDSLLWLVVKVSDTLTDNRGGG